MNSGIGRPAPELDVAQWLNADAALSLARLRGRPIVIEAFQMLCPGCVYHGLPLAQRIAAAFAPTEVVVLGLHCVFEHHDVQGGAAALAAFLHEYRLDFPVAIDRPTGGVPATMSRYRLQGTPTLLLIDADGLLRAHHFGSVPDLQIGAEIGALLHRRRMAEA